MKRTTKKRTTRKALVLKGMSIGAIAMKAIMAGKGVDAVIAGVKKEWPKANTGRNSVLWYRSELRRQGHEVPPLARQAAEKPKKKEVKGKKAALRIRAVRALDAPAAERKAAAAQ